MTGISEDEESSAHQLVKLLHRTALGTSKQLPPFSLQELNQGPEEWDTNVLP